MPDLALLLEQHVEAGFPRDLALDLVLNELVVRAADATHATAAALALLRGDEIVCRAATGLHAPELGTPLDTDDGLTGACVRTRTPQLCIDTESDPRVDSALSRRLGIRSVLMVPLFDREAKSTDGKPLLTGVLEVFSPLPNIFSHQSQVLLGDFGDECERICRVAAQLKTHPPSDVVDLDEEAITSEEDAAEANEVSGAIAGNLAIGHEGESDSPAVIEDGISRLPEAELIAEPALDGEVVSAKAAAHQPYEIWTLVLGGLVIVAAAGFSFMIGSRIGWLRPPATPLAAAARAAPEGDSGQAVEGASPSGHKEGAKSAVSKSGPGTRSASARENPTGSSTDDLVVYDKDKVIFRMGPTAAGGQGAAIAASGSKPPEKSSPEISLPVKARNGSGGVPHSVWLAPSQAETRLLTRVEPQYPADALAAHRSGEVTLEVHVAEDGTVSSVRTLSGDPLLANAAAEAVRGWRYEPYRANNQPAKFQTDVTLTFTLPN
jgi:TonB family protein